MQHKHHWYRSNIVMFPFKVLIERGVPLDMAIVVDVPSIGSIFFGGIPLINSFIKKIPTRTSTAEYARQEEMANANVGVHDDGDGRGNGSALDSGLSSDPVGDVGTLPLVFAVHCFGCSAM
eukprot:scaffold4206_cov196-Alexandrium_tamarense.AAC.28